jgi:hypothetical protein
MSRNEAKQLYLESSKKLKAVFGTKLYYVSDIHHLLFLSHYGYRTLYQKVAELDVSSAPTGLDQLVLAMPSTILISPQSEACNVSRHLLLCSETGRIFEISKNEKKLLELFKKERRVGEAVSIWVSEQEGKDLESRIKLITAAFVAIKGFLKTRLLAPAPLEITGVLVHDRKV